MKHAAIVLAALAMTSLVVAACEAPPPRQPPAPPAPPPPPSPELPMTRAKAREILSGLSLNCTTLANLRYDMMRCDQHMGRGPDDAGFREEMRSLRAELDALPADTVSARCSEIRGQLEVQPIPRPCWEMAAMPED